MYASAHALQASDRPALVMARSGAAVTYGQFEARANQIAHLLRAIGLSRLDHVAFLMENDPALLVCGAAAERTGLIYTPVSTHLAVDQIAHIVNDSTAQVVITSNTMLDVARALPARCPRVRHWFIASANSPIEEFESLEASIRGLPTFAVADEQLGAPMLYSAGTTGRPKGVYRKPSNIHPGVSTPALNFTRKLLGMREGMVYLSPAPLYHSAPQTSVSTALRLGATSVIMEKFDAAEFLDLIGKYRITHTQVVPTMFSRLLALPEPVRADADISSLEQIVHAAAPCPIPVKEKIIDWFGPIVVEYYSATEANGATRCESAEWLERKGTVGKPLLGRVHILDADGASCPAGEVGTIWFQGATNFTYFNDPDQTAASRNPSGDMSSVGDVGYLDDEGYLYLTDRKSMMIISGGVNIYPQETENILLTHASVQDVAVIGVPNEDLGEEVKAVVQLMPGVAQSEVLAQELIGYCRDRLSHIACPRSVDFTLDLPRTPTGKLAKRLVRDRYWPDAPRLSLDPRATRVGPS